MARSSVTIVVAAMFAIAFAGSTALAEIATIEGTALYRERIALKPDMVLEVELLDISRPDTPSERLASFRIRPQSLPIPFVLHYDTSLIDPRHRYAVSARLLRNSKTVFRSDTVHPVLTAGGGDKVAVMMVSTTAGSPRPKPASLVGSSWVAEDIDGEGVMDNLQSFVTFGADGSVHGSGGCNRFTGKYVLDKSNLSFGPLAGTRKACFEAVMNQETRFHKALATVTAYRIENGLLFLLNKNGQTVIRCWQRK